MEEVEEEEEEREGNKGALSACMCVCLSVCLHALKKQNCNSCVEGGRVRNNKGDGIKCLSARKGAAA